MTELWFESILAPTRTRNWDGERRGRVSLAEAEGYHYIKPSGKQIQGFQGWHKMEGFRKPYSGTLRFHKTSGSSTLNLRAPSAGYDDS
jgi:hypothetical protein